MSSNDRSWIHARLPREAREALEAGLPASEVWSFLLGVMEARAARRTPASLREQWARDRFVEPCYLDQRTLLAMDSALLGAAPAFESIELSPVAPLGVCSAMALASQNKIVSTARGTEVVSDPTNVMALECARRLYEDSARVVRLVTSHRCVRAQAIPKVRGFAAHFRLFCLASAGHEQKNRALLSGELVEHICTQLAALDALERVGYSFGARKLRFLISPGNSELAERVAAGVVERRSHRGASGGRARSMPEGDAGPSAALEYTGAATAALKPDAGQGATLNRDPEGAQLPVEYQPLEQAYYDGLRFQIDVTAPNGAILPLIDGGAFDWMRKLMSNGKMVFVASAMGSQLAAYLFRTNPGPEPSLPGT
jgi:hypothetical protein